MNKGRCRVSEEVATALAERRPVVAVELGVVDIKAQGEARLSKLRLAEDRLRRRGAVPAAVYFADGSIHVGATEAGMQKIAESDDIDKVSSRDIAIVTARRRLGLSTVSSTVCIAAAFGIRFALTGAIGGVHRDYSHCLDISADLVELARAPVGVVCAGGKIILDLPNTLEMLETLGVPTIGVGHGNFPGYITETGLGVDAVASDASDAAEIARTKWDLGLTGGVLLVAPLTKAARALQPGGVEEHVGGALEEASRQGIRGKAVTPFLLRALSERMGPQLAEISSEALVTNAEIAADIAVAYHEVT